jgi:hypothetical protein
MPDPFRLGYPGSPLVAIRLVRRAGLEPREDVRLTTYDVADPFRAIREGSLDVMIVKYRAGEPDLLFTRALDYEGRAAVVGSAHPLASRASISIEEVCDYGVFDRPGEFPAYLWDDVVPPRTPSGRELRRVHRVPDLPSLMRMLAGSNAVHVSLTTLAHIAPRSIRVVPIADLPPVPVALAWRRDVELPARVRRFIEASERAASAVSDPFPRDLPVVLLDGSHRGSSLERLGVPALRSFDERGSDRVVLVGSAIDVMAVLERHPDRVSGVALSSAGAEELADVSKMTRVPVVVVAGEDDAAIVHLLEQAKYARELCEGTS